MATKLLRRPAVESRVGCRRSFLYAMMDDRSESYDPTFPRPIRLGRRAVAWIESEIDDWIKGKIQKARDAV